MLSRGSLPPVESLVAIVRAGPSLKTSETADIRIFGRKPAPRFSTFPTEVATCRLGDGRRVQLFFKYSTGSVHESHGHRGGVSYEAAVYRELLRHCRLSTPTYYGSRDDPECGRGVLVLGELEGAVRITKSPDASAVVKAADWIARFHSLLSIEDLPARYPFLRVYDEEYFLGWARRTLTFGESHRRRYPWIATVCRNFAELIALLLRKPPTVVHGEYYSQNILYQDGNIFPVDWESAAVSAGEIDLASLTEGWPKETARQCEARYLNARYPDGAPANFQTTLDVARLYLMFRWLGDRPRWTDEQAGAGLRFEQLHSLARRMGLL